TEQQLKDGFTWACEFGRTDVVDFLLRNGMDLQAQLKHDGQTGLHWAAFGGHPDTVRLLLNRGAPVDVRDKSHDGTPLDWALYAWGGPPDERSDRYYDVVAQLARAGAKLELEWYEDDSDRKRAAAKMHADPRMLSALRGEVRKR